MALGAVRGRHVLEVENQSVSVCLGGPHARPPFHFNEGGRRALWIQAGAGRPAREELQSKQKQRVQVSKQRLENKPLIGYGVITDRPALRHGANLLLYTLTHARRHTHKHTHTHARTRSKQSTFAAVRKVSPSESI